MQGVLIPRKGVGEPSSKYGYPGGDERFEKDIQANNERYEFLWNEFVDFMKSHDVDPRIFRRMFTRYCEEFFGRMITND